jgi:hypothetical protein
VPLPVEPARAAVVAPPPAPAAEDARAADAQDGAARVAPDAPAAVGGVAAPDGAESADATDAADPAYAPDAIDPTDAAGASRNRRPAPRRAEARAIALVAPPGVEWATLDGKRLGRGEIAASIATGAGVVARDVQRALVTRVDARELEDGRVVYAELPTGLLSVRAYPWADVAVGEVALGQTPFAPVRLTAGRARVTLRYEGKVKVVVVDIPAGGTAQLAEDLR